MHIILGGTGHVGSAVAETLLGKNEEVTVVTHSASAGDAWKSKGAQIALVDVHDTDALRNVFRSGRRLFLLNPPAAPSTDTDAEERSTLRSILAAIDDSGLEKIVAESTYGARKIERAGDLGILYDMEQTLAAQPIPTSVIRAAYYMSNWDMSLKTAREEGKVHTFYPADFMLPMVAPHDLGDAGARLLLEPVDSTGLHYVEGPQRYSSADVARAFANALGKPVEVDVIPRERWVEGYTSLGFSEAAAKSYAAMTAATLDDDYEMPTPPERGRITLDDYVTNLVEEARSKKDRTDRNLKDA